MFKIYTDNGSDIPEDYAAEHGIETINLATIIDGVVYNQGVELSKEEFYKRLANGAKPSTSQVNPDQAKKFFEERIDQADEFLFIGISSGLSGTVQSVLAGAKEVMEKHPGKRIEVVDSLTGSLGEMLLVTKAVDMRDAGKSFDETVAYVRDNAIHASLAITVDNLMDLWRGGRVSKTSAFIGTLAAIKPMLHVNYEGKLISVDKVRGRKKALSWLVEEMEEKMGSFKDKNKEMIMINHGDCLEDAEKLRDMIKEHFGYENFMINNLSPVIGSHTGPSLIALFFMGDVR